MNSSRNKDCKGIVFIKMEGIDNSSDGEWEEESNVLVELSGVIDCDFLSSQETKFHTKALGLDTANPVVQIGSHIFSGQYEADIGTSIILEETIEDGKPQLKYLCHTDKKLMLKRAFLQNKDKPVSVTIDADELDDSSREATVLEHHIVDEDEETSK